MPRSAPNKRKLTPLAVAKLPPAAKPYLLWDTYQRGLALLVQPSGYRSYKLIYRHHNRPRWLTIGAADAIGLAEARKLAAELMLEVIRGRDPQAERQAERGAGTFAELAQRYVEEYAKKRNKSWRQGNTLIRRFVLPTLGAMSVQAIARSDVRAVISKVNVNGAIQANQVLAAMSAVFNWATKQDLLTNNPCRGVERNQTHSRERILTDAEVPLFWQAFATAGVAGMALQVLLLTGQRPGEVAHMRWAHIKDGWWEMPGAEDNGWPGTKNKQTHRVWLPKVVQDIIAPLRGEEFVFGRLWNLADAMRKLQLHGDFERATPHDLRRTHGSTIAALGFGRDAMNRIQNHKEGGIASVYDRHSYSDENKRIMENVGAHIMGLVHGAATNVLAFTQQR
jgi:integrase